MLESAGGRRSYGCRKSAGLSIRAIMGLGSLYIRSPPGTWLRSRRDLAPEIEEPSYGIRILVDRLWPRGLTEGAIDRWMRDLAPSTELRRWFGHDPSRWDEFRWEYARELRERANLLEEVRSLARQRRVTLLFGARDEAQNHAVVLREVLLRPAAS